MCGIVALFSGRDPISIPALYRATQSLYHRGPDGQKHWVAADRRVGLGHTRCQPVTQKIRGMTEKYVLREAVRDLITDTVYRRQKHLFLSPPATLNSEKKLSRFVEETLRSSVLKSIPFLDQKRVVALLDGLVGMDEGSRIATDQLLMTLVSACVLQDRFRLAA